MACGLFDLNTVENEDETISFVSASSSVASGNSESAAMSSTVVCMELWHACAGPLILLPRKGNAIVYFPQGHVEHLPEHPAIVYDLPPHVFCRVVDVKLHSDTANDEVYAQVSLIPDQQICRLLEGGSKALCGCISLLVLMRRIQRREELCCTTYPNVAQ